MKRWPRTFRRLCTCEFIYKFLFPFLRWERVDAHKFFKLSSCYYVVLIRILIPVVCVSDLYMQIFSQTTQYQRAWKTCAGE